MNHVILESDGRLLHCDRLIQSAPLDYLGIEIRLAQGCTLRSFFRSITRYPQLARLNPYLKSFLALYQQCSATGCTCDEIAYLALTRTMEMIGHPPPVRVVLSVSLHGYGADGPCDLRQYELENLLDTPLKIGPLNHVVFGDDLDTMQFATVFNLFELIDGICWQLSFHNRPAACRLQPS